MGELLSTRLESGERFGRDDLIYMIRCLEGESAALQATLDAVRRLPAYIKIFAGEAETVVRSKDLLAALDAVPGIRPETEGE